MKHRGEPDAPVEEKKEKIVAYFGRCECGWLTVQKSLAWVQAVAVTHSLMHPDAVVREITKFGPEVIFARHSADA